MEGRVRPKTNNKYYTTIPTPVYTMSNKGEGVYTEGPSPVQQTFQGSKGDNESEKNNC